jgi:hypothetical protein
VVAAVVDGAIEVAATVVAAIVAEVVGAAVVVGLVVPNGMTVSPTPSSPQAPMISSMAIVTAKRRMTKPPESTRVSV